MISPGHFYLTKLPELGDLGSPPPIGLADLLDHVEENRKWREPLEALLLSDDILQRESLLAGEIDEAKPAVLSIPQVRAEAPLPEALDLDVSEWDALDAIASKSTALEIDTLWGRYFRFAHRVAQTHSSRFLGHWVAFEVGLRNALAAERARRLELNEADYQVAIELGDYYEDVSQVLSAWETTSTPLTGLQEVIRARWLWVERHDARYSFSVDELLAYAARVMLLEQWQRITRAIAS